MFAQYGRYHPPLPILAHAFTYLGALRSAEYLETGYLSISLSNSITITDHPNSSLFQLSYILDTQSITSLMIYTKRSGVYINQPAKQVTAKLSILNSILYRGAVPSPPILRIPPSVTLSLICSLGALTQPTHSNNHPALVRATAVLSATRSVAHYCTCSLAQLVRPLGRLP